MSKKRKFTPEQVAAIKMRQKEIISEFNRRQVSSGRGMSNLGEPFTVSKSKKLSQSALIGMQRDRG